MIREHTGLVVWMERRDVAKFRVEIGVWNMEEVGGAVDIPRVFHVPTHRTSNA